MKVGINVGPADALVKIVDFEDFQCPHCARFENVVQMIRDKYPDQVAFAFAPFPLPYHDFALPAQRVVECAQIQGRYDAMRSLLFEKQQAFGSLAWAYFAAQAGVEDISAFNECVKVIVPLERIEQSKIVAEKLGVRGTPTIFVNGWKLPGTPSFEIMDKVVTNVIEGSLPAKDIDFLAVAAPNGEEERQTVSKKTMLEAVE